MLTRIDLRHFKCFTLLKLPLRPLTLLSGRNASGKSSVIQALGLLHQTMREHEWSVRLMLNGGTIRLGTAEDVIDKISGRRSCEIALQDDETMYKWKFEGDRDEMSLALASFSMDGEFYELELMRRLMPDVPDSVSDRLCGLTWLSAERMGPREIHPLEDPQLTPVVGPTGEHVANVLHLGHDARVVDALTIEGQPPTRWRQVEARMGQFFPGFEMAMDKFPNANAVSLGIRTSKDTDFHRPGHTGFGVTQVLPIVVAALSADCEGLLLIENPEVHLHPAGQAKMGGFLAEVAAAGVQVIMETHSDHVLNGVRRAVKDKILAPNDAALHFFRPRQEAERDGVSQIQTPHLDGEGNIDDWPEGFFDQFDKDMNYFAGWN